MKKISLIFTGLVLMSASLLGQNLKAYQIFTSKGKKVSYSRMIKKIQGADLIFFGELHNDPIAHWLQLELTQELHQKRELILGAEMFERDNEKQLKAYLDGTIDYQGLDSMARLWNNFKTDYKPLVDFAKNENIPFVSTNIPRRYASLVYRNGFEALDDLSEEEKSWIAPLPFDYDGSLPGYQNMREMMGGHGGDNFPKAQAVKDATMGYFIAENYREGALFIHYNGSYHSDNHGEVIDEGILWYLDKYLPNKTSFNITTVLQKQLKTLEKENRGKADFVLVVTEKMTRTY